MITLRIDGLSEARQGIADGRDNLGAKIYKAMANSVNAVKNTAQELVPFDTGQLRRSIFSDIEDSGFRGIVGQNANEAPYGIHIEYGTGPHEIVPVVKKALFWKGALYPVKRVMHPGFAGHPFMKPALENNIDTIKQYFTDAINEIINIMAK
jgi:HK97 gp10 family phage protein